MKILFFFALVVLSSISYPVFAQVPDTDGDGISDSIDQCPTQAETFNGSDDSDGCPDVVAPKDTDVSDPEDCESDQVRQNNQCVDASISPKNDLNLQTDKIRYGQGDVVVITGMIHNIENLSTGDVAIIVRAPDNNIAAILMVDPNADGSFQTSFNANGPQFKAAGDYTILANFSGLKSEITFGFTGGNGNVGGTYSPPSNKDAITQDTGLYLSATASENSDTVYISGYAKLQIPDITFTVISPSLNVISVSQLTPDANGYFATELKVNPMWKESGFYTIKVEQSPHGSSLYDVSLRVEVINGRTSAMETQEKLDEVEKINLENEYSPKEREWITSGPFQIDRSQYAVGEKIFLVVEGLNANENGEIAFMRPINDMDYSVYLTIPFDGSTKPAFNYYVEPQISKTNEINSVDDLLGEWIIVFRGTEYPNLHFKITKDVVPGTDIESDYEDLPYEITIKAALGSSSPGCEETSQGCFIPKSVSVAADGKVIFSNTDTAAHTFTSGAATDETPGEVFNSGLVMAGSSYEWTPTTKGQYDYFCMLHPWMTGTIFVGEGTHIPPQPEDDLDLQVIMENQVYDLSDTATMNLYINGISTPQNVALEISDPRGTTVISRSFEVDSQGISFEFRIDENFKTGTYKVVATTSDNGNTVSDTAYFKVISQYNSFKIISVQATDQQGNPSNLQAGEIGFIKVNLEANKSITTLVTVNLFDSDLTSIGIGSIKTTLSSGNSEIILSFMIPSDVSVGPADIYVNAFSDWPSNGGIPLTGEISVMENIE